MQNFHCSAKQVKDTEIFILPTDGLCSRTINSYDCPREFLVSHIMSPWQFSGRFLFWLSVQFNFTNSAFIKEGTLYNKKEFNRRMS